MALTSAAKALDAAKRDTGWVDVRSSNILQIRHSGAPVNRLSVRFHGGGSGYYSDVPRDIYYQMTRAASKGKFLHRRLKGTYTWTAT